jgi:hypothetical protein
LFVDSDLRLAADTRYTKLGECWDGLLKTRKIRLLFFGLLIEITAADFRRCLLNEQCTVDDEECHVL